jgi:microcystin-dependent protein
MDPFVAEIRIFACNFAPVGWAFCNGQTMPISQNTALFSLLGTYYGGNGISNFQLPNFQARASIHQGQGTGLSTYTIGQTGGDAMVTLTNTQLPSHNHLPTVATPPTNANPANLTWAGATGRPVPNSFANDPNATAVMNANALSNTGGNQPHNNLMPYLSLNFCIALQGVYPPRS